MRLRNEKYSYRLWMVLNPDREKENEWWFQFFTMDQIWQDIKVISNHRLSVSLPRQNRMFSFWVIRKDLLLERHKLTFSEWLLQSLPFIKLSGKQSRLMFTARLHWHQSSATKPVKIANTTWLKLLDMLCSHSAQTKSLQNLVDCRIPNHRAHLSSQFPRRPL